MFSSSSQIDEILIRSFIFAGEKEVSMREMLRGRQRSRRYQCRWNVQKGKFIRRPTDGILANPNKDSDMNEKVNRCPFQSRDPSANDWLKFRIHLTRWTETCAKDSKNVKVNRVSEPMDTNQQREKDEESLCLCLFNFYSRLATNSNNNNASFFSLSRFFPRLIISDIS